MMQLATLMGHTTQVLYLAISPDGQVGCLPSLHSYPHLLLYSRALFVFSYGEMTFSFIYFSLQKIVTGSGDGTLCFWKLFPTSKSRVMAYIFAQQSWFLFVTMLTFVLFCMQTVCQPKVYKATNLFVDMMFLYGTPIAKQEHHLLDEPQFVDSKSCSELSDFMKRGGSIPHALKYRTCQHEPTHKMQSSVEMWSWFKK